MQTLAEEEDSRQSAFVFIVKAAETEFCAHAHFRSCDEPVRFRGERHAETLAQFSFHLKGVYGVQINEGEVDLYGF